MLYTQFPCRRPQIDILSKLFSRSQLPPLLAVHGSTATGKSSITEAVIRYQSISPVVINARECINLRHILEAILYAIHTLSRHDVADINAELQSRRCENVNALSAYLNEMPFDRDRIVIILDDIDKAREVSQSLLSAVAQLGQTISGLTIVMIMTTINTRFLRIAGIPYVYFSPYSRDECLQIMQQPVPPIFLQRPSANIPYTEDFAHDDDEWVWRRYLEVLWDSLAKDAARDLVGFRELAEKLWRSFVAPIVDGSIGTRDFPRLLASRRGLFRDEESLVETIVPASSEPKRCHGRPVIHDLSYYSKYLLCAAYLASYSPSRQDAVLFMKGIERRKRRRGLVGRSKTLRHRKITRQLLAPSSFTLDRLMAICHAIAPRPIDQTSECHTHLATLRSLHLLVRTGMGADSIDPACKWRVNFGMEYAVALGRSIGFELAEYLKQDE